MLVRLKLVRPNRPYRRRLARCANWLVPACALVVIGSPACVLFGDERSASPQDAPAEDREGIEFFERRIRPILLERCAECHSAKAKPLHGGLRVDGRKGLLAGGDSGPVLVPHKPDESRLLAAVRYDDVDMQMPPSGKLPSAEIALLEEWIRRGAPLPPDRSGTSDPNDDATRSGSATRPPVDFAAARQFWSFRPLSEHDSPLASFESSEHTASPHSAAWPRQPIDGFLLAVLKTASLGPSEEADRRTLIRRATFDLLGLPPSPEEIAEFTADDSPDAYERLIDRLLASPQYGVRWGRYWLDLVRYTDTTDEWLEATPAAFRYRDWVVRALNDDMPYDDFVRRQLATDMLESTGPDDYPALGFLGLSPTYWKELRLAPDVIEAVVAEEREERIDAVGRTFLGLSLACARCHDHKFDPVTMEDYYGLAGVFASVRIADRLMLPSDAAEQVTAAREEVTRLEEQLKTLRAKKPASGDEKTARDDAVPNVDAEANANADANTNANADAKVDETAREVARIETRIRELRSTAHFDAPSANVVVESSLYVLPDGPDMTKLEYRPGVPRDVPIQRRGSPTNLGPIVPRRFLQLFAGGVPQIGEDAGSDSAHDGDSRTASASHDGSPPPFSHGSGRRELADAIVGPAGPLAARVIVNRVWMHHFGRGLVNTPSDFGVQGDRPSHPELLDDLAARFVHHGWSIKWLHREIMLSAAYRQSSRFDAARHAVDPDNRLLWRANRRRLEVEAWRDSLLSAAGSLDSSLGGPAASLDDPDNHRRTIYGLVNRRELSAILSLHDFPSAERHSPRREPTTTPLQQLFTMNSPFMRRRAEELLARLANRPDAAPTDVTEHAEPPRDRRIEAAYEWLFGREPNGEERKLAAEFLGDQPSDEDWRDYLHALLGDNEFLFVD